jgi:hypothetical protein
MKISTTHQNLSEVMDYSKVLTEPENYLGTNWKEVLNFWIYLDDLSEPVKKRLIDCDKSQLYIVFDEYMDLIDRMLAESDLDYVAENIWYSVESFSHWEWFSYWASLELLCHQKLLNQGMDLKYFSLFIPPKPKIVLVSTPKGEVTMDYMKSIVNKFYPNLFGDQPFSSQMFS